MTPRSIHPTRRQVLRTALATVPGVIAGPAMQAQTTAPAGTDPKIQGPFPILTTPFTEAGQVDFDGLVKQARFVNWCGSSGMIWPQSSDSVDLLTMDEKLEGMQLLAEASRDFSAALCLGVQGRDTEEMLVYARHAEQLQSPAIISRPPDSGKTEDDLRTYWRALAAVTDQPVILQTTGGTAYKGPAPSIKLLTTLAGEFSNFGYVKEEAGNVIARTRELLAARPPIRRVFSSRGAHGWLYESHLGTEGLITERAVYADLLMKIWELMQSGSDPDTLRDIYGRFLLMLSLAKTHPGNELRGFQLYLWKKRGIFKNLISRHYGPDRSFPTSPIFSEQQFSEEEIAEIDFRFEGLKPYLKSGTPDFL